MCGGEGAEAGLVETIKSENANVGFSLPDSSFRVVVDRGIVEWYCSYCLLSRFPLLQSAYHPVVVRHLLSLPRDISRFFTGCACLSRRLATEQRHRVAVLWESLLVDVLVIHPESAEEVLRSRDRLAKSQEYDSVRDGILTPADAKWHRRRKLLTTGFLGTMNEHRDTLVRSVADSVKQGKDLT